MNEFMSESWSAIGWCISHQWYRRY